MQTILTLSMETKTVRISKEAFDAIKTASEAERRTFIAQVDWMILVNKQYTNGIQKVTKSNQPQKRFKKPDKAEVFFYIQENSYNVDVDKWYSHYESNGWKVGKNPMKDWKAAVRTWHSPEEKKKTNEGWQHNPTVEVHTEARDLQPSVIKKGESEDFYGPAKRRGEERNTRTGGGTRLKNIIYGNNGKE